MGGRGLPRRYTDYIIYNGKRYKIFDFPAEFVDRVKGRGLSLKELTDEWKRFQREKGLVANG